MLKSGKDGTIVWFRMANDRAFKIEWQLEIFLKMVEEAHTEAGARANWYNVGKISRLEKSDLEELDSKVDPYWEYVVQEKFKKKRRSVA